MELIKFVFAAICLDLCDAAQAGNRSHLQPHSSPAYIVMGNNGEILRCPLHNPAKCELVCTASSPVLDVLIHGEHFYASLKNGKILKCHWYGKQQCTVFHQADDSVYSLVATGVYLYASMRKSVMCCELNVPQSCSTVHTFEYVVPGLYEHDKYVYAVSGDDIFRCSKHTKFECILVAADEYRGPAIAVSGWGDSIITLAWADLLHTHNVTSNTIIPKRYHLGYYYFDMAVFEGIVYMVDTAGTIHTCKCDKPTSCTKYVHHEDARSISFVYATYSVRSSRPGVSCRQSSRGSVFEYRAEHRGQLEVRVAAGKLVDARGALVDTRRADAGYSGRAAVFAMGPGGRILVSHAHRSGLVHITSLFAGSPVAGAGEVHVEHGVIKRIVACSESYLADVELNRQVVHELYSRGYTRAEEIQLEECIYTCDGD